MAHCNTVLSQIVRILPRHEFESLASKHHVGQKFRSFSRWTQFIALLSAQLTGRDSMRDIVDNFAAQVGKLYNLGIKVYEFLTNALDIPAATVADMYKERWQIELVFKWINQNLHIKSFLVTSRNAVMTQIWNALCAYLLLAFHKFQSKLGQSLQQILRLLQLNLFDRRDFLKLFAPPKPKLSLCDKQLSLI